MGELPYAPIAGALRSLVRERGAEETASLFDPGGEVLGLLVPDAAPERRPAGGFAEREGAQGRLFARWLAGLSAASRESPLALVVEDLHWADRATRDFVLFLAGNLRRERLVVVASYRSDELHRRHPGRRFVPCSTRWTRWTAVTGPTSGSYVRTA